MFVSKRRFRSNILRKSYASRIKWSVPKTSKWNKHIKKVISIEKSQKRNILLKKCSILKRL